MTLVHLIELVQATSMLPVIEPDLVDKAVADFFDAVKASDWQDALPLCRAGILKELCSQDLRNLQKDFFLLHLQDCNTGAQQASKSGSSYRTIYLLQNCIPAVWRAWSQLALQRKAVLFCMVQ